eukprot:1002725-Rhodomonas_salina.2
MELLAGVDVARSTLVDVGALAREPVALPAVVALAFEAPIEVRALGVGVTRTALSALIDVVAICAVAAEPGVARACERPIGIRASSVGGARDGRSFALQDVGAGRVRGIIVVRIARISHLARARRASNDVRARHQRTRAAEQCRAIGGVCNGTALVILRLKRLEVEVGDRRRVVPPPVRAGHAARSTDPGRGHR